MWRNNYSAIQKKNFSRKKFFLEVPGIFFPPARDFFLPPEFFLGA